MFHKSELPNQCIDFAPKLEAL